MDGKRFQDWLAGIDSLSETQRTEALGGTFGAGRRCFVAGGGRGES